MKAALVLMLLFLLLCGFISLLLLNFSMSYDSLFMFLSTRIFRYSVFNSIIFVILARSFRSSAGEVDEFLPFPQLLSGELEQIEEREYASEDSNRHGSDDDDSHCESGGYEEDDDDNGSDSDIGWIEDDEETDHDLENKAEADEEIDHDLENKVEAFISMVIQGWKEELMRDKTALDM